MNNYKSEMTVSRKDIEELVRDNIKQMDGYASARDEFRSTDKDIMYLDANEHPYDNGINRYPDPQQTALKTVISKCTGISTNQILLGNGSDEVLDLIFRAFCEPNVDNIITLPPSYGMYEVLANLNSIDNLQVQLDDAFEPDVERILATQNTSSKLLLLCVPNNPTGNSFDPLRITQLIENFNGIVVIDEAYIDFSNHESWINYLDNFSNLIVIRTLSKAYGMAGIRLGMCFASKEIISVLNKIKPPYNVNQLTQDKALKQLSTIETIKSEIKKITKQRAWLSSELSKINVVTKVYPSQTNFLLVQFDNANLRYRQLLEKGIVVRNRSNQPLCKGCLRITVGTALENKTLIKVLKGLNEYNTRQK